MRFKVLSEKLDKDTDLSKLDFDQLEGTEVGPSQMDGVELSDDQLAGVAGGLGDIEDEVPPCLCGGRFRVDFMSGPWYYFSCEKCGAQLIGG